MELNKIISIKYPNEMGTFTGYYPIEEMKIKCPYCGTENSISNLPGIYYCSNCGLQI